MQDRGGREIPPPFDTPKLGAEPRRLPAARSIVRDMCRHIRARAATFATQRGTRRAFSQLLRREIAVPRFKLK
jgi:hypothetical protein